MRPIAHVEEREGLLEEGLDSLVRRHMFDRPYHPVVGDPDLDDSNDPAPGTLLALFSS